MLDNPMVTMKVFHWQNVQQKTYVDVDGKVVVGKSKNFHWDSLKYCMKKNLHRNWKVNNDWETSCWRVSPFCENVQFVSSHEWWDGRPYFFRFQSFLFSPLSLSLRPYCMHSRWLTSMIGRNEIERKRQNERTKEREKCLLVLFEDVPCADDWRDGNDTIQQI